MVATVGFSRFSGVVLVETSEKLGEPKGFATEEAFDESNCSPALASDNFHSAVSVSRVNFQEFVAVGNVTETERIFSILKKSLFNHCSGLGSLFCRDSEIKDTEPDSPLTWTYLPSG